MILLTKLQFILLSSQRIGTDNDNDYMTNNNDKCIIKHKCIQ